MSMFTKAPFLDISTARTKKMMELLHLEPIISRHVAVGCECVGGNIPSEPVEVRLLVTPLSIYSAARGNKTKSVWVTLFCN